MILLLVIKLSLTDLRENHMSSVFISHLWNTEKIIIAFLHTDRLTKEESLILTFTEQQKPNIFPSAQSYHRNETG